jgi:prefoldin subunit 5
MTNQEIFYKDVDALKITEIQKLMIKFGADSYAHEEYREATKLGQERLEKFVKNL